MTAPLSKRVVLGGVTIFGMIFLSLPTMIVLATSFTASDVIRFPPEGFSLRWYAKLLEAGDIQDAFIRSLIVGAICTAIAIPVGTCAAIGMHKYRIKGLSVLRLYFLLPFTIPLVVSGICLMILYGQLGILDRLWTVGLSLCIVNLPFMIWAVGANVNALDPDLENAGANLGAPPLQTFLFITLPAVLPGIVTGSMLMFVLALNDFVVSLLLVTKRIMTLPVEIFISVRAIITPDLAAVAVVYVLIAIIAIFVLDRTIGLDAFLKSRVGV